MNLRLRIVCLALPLVFCTAVSHAQNGNSSAPQSTAPAPGVTGLTIHGSNAQGQSTIVPTTPSSNASAVMARLAEANQLFAQRKIPDAAIKYQEIVKADPKVALAQVGLMRCLLMMHKVDNAQAAATAALAALPTSPQVLTAAADVQFRSGKIPESEKLYVKAENLDPKAPEPYLGLAQIYKAYSLYGRAYQNLKKAHEVAPNNPPVQLMYFHSLPHADQIPTLEAYLAKPDINPQMARGLQGYLTALKKGAAAPAHVCKLVSNVQQTDTKLNSVARPDTRLGAVGLNVQINKQDVRLALDTGATGVLLGRAAAEKLGLQRLGYQPIMGMGDSGSQGGYTALANRIRIGSLEFQDCVVKVTDAESPVTGQDGLIGSDVFSSYLIDIDIPAAKLRLSPLPKRPNESAQPAALQTMSQEQGEDADESSDAAKAGGLSDIPMDAYVDPSMANWTKVYRFRSLLLVPTSVDHIGPLLFMLDSGSFSNILSTRTAQQVTALRSNPNMQVRGMSGTVSKVYTADKATLQFGRYSQDNQDVVALDLSNVSRQTGTEVSGILGFRMLRILQIKIDYRDGLVDFVFDPRHLPKDIDIYSK
jgi:tetratricopeptide (TPR) repeat protein